MPRPRRNRKIFRPPVAGGYVPFDTTVQNAGCVILLFEEYEALRLADYEGLTQEEASKMMDVSRPTFSRIYDVARQKLARTLVEGLTLRIEGGSHEFEHTWFRCNACNTSFSQPESAQFDCCPVCRSADIREIGTSAVDAADVYLKPNPAVHQTGFCVCPRCGLMVSHQPGIPCRSMVCSSCGSSMIREHHPMQP